MNSQNNFFFCGSGKEGMGIPIPSLPLPQKGYGNSQTICMIFCTFPRKSDPVSFKNENSKFVEQFLESEFFPDKI